MVKKLYTVTDLGPGDGGKGGVVHKLCAHFHAHHVIKVGGAQGSHGVRTSRGDRFAFSQFGCGTFDGSRTHISERFVADPNGLLNEAGMLKYKCGVHDARSLVTLDERTLCMTPWHQISSRLEEMARKDNPRGTIGVGVGVAYRSMLRYPGLAIYAGDLKSPDLKDKLACVAACSREELALIVQANDFLEADRSEASQLIERLYDDGLIDWTYDRFRECAQIVCIVGPEYMKSEVLGRDGTVVVESSHGVLTDKYHGFAPHTSKFRTLPELTTWSMLREYGYDGRVYKLGVTRAYQIRHGAGPMVTDDPTMVETLLPGSHKDENRYQGRVRVGPLDLVALRYAIEVCGGPQAFDGLAITWFDQIQKNGIWKVCTGYDVAAGSPVDGSPLFLPDGNIAVRRGEDDTQLMYQEVLSHSLQFCEPIIRDYQIPPGADQSSSVDLCRSVLKEALGVPVRMISFGPTEIDKVLC